MVFATFWCSNCSCRMVFAPRIHLGLVYLGVSLGFSGWSSFLGLVVKFIFGFTGLGLVVYLGFVEDLFKVCLRFVSVWFRVCLGLA